MYNIKKIYEILGLNDNASLEEVKQNYRDLVKIWHPDRFNNDLRLQKKASEKLIEINRAYNELCSYMESHRNKPIKYDKSCNDKDDNKENGVRWNTFDQVNEAYSPIYPSDTLKFIKEYWYLVLTLFIGFTIIIFLYYGDKSSPKKSLPFLEKTQKSTGPTKREPTEKPEPIAPIPPKQKADIPLKPINPVSLPLGSSPFGGGIRSGNSLITIDNGTKDDALVKLFRFKDNKEKLIRNFYIPAGKKIAANKIPQGEYKLKVSFGNDWDRKLRKFNYNRHFSMTEPFDITETKWTEPVEEGYIERTRYTKMNITLHKVMYGNFKSHEISEEAFEND